MKSAFTSYDTIASSGPNTMVLRSSREVMVVTDVDVETFPLGASGFWIAPLMYYKLQPQY